MSQCPEGFTQQILPIEMECNVFYCIKKHSVDKYRHPKLIRPPFALPQIAENKYSETNIRAIYDGIELFST
uniref:Uncharacterized protein n=1 Tax=Panagrolaimus sp. ES5 TaxID=591445 RepID=A0AC34GI67_9BILA